MSDRFSEHSETSGPASDSSSDHRQLHPEAADAQNNLVPPELGTTEFTQPSMQASEAASSPPPPEEIDTAAPVVDPRHDAVVQGLGPQAVAHSKDETDNKTTDTANKDRTTENEDEHQEDIHTETTAAELTHGIGEKAVGHARKEEEGKDEEEEYKDREVDDDDVEEDRRSDEEKNEELRERIDQLRKTRPTFKINEDGELTGVKYQDESGRMSGYVTARTLQEPDGPNLKIDWMTVAPDLEGHGFATEMVRTLLDGCREHDIATIDGKFMDRHALSAFISAVGEGTLMEYSYLKNGMIYAKARVTR
jgi:hypothetical protein